ncbi:MAG: OmpA family protein [Bacteroidales bacterium]|nr:OmpA family protein [Bacteroidales bacterium]
MRRELLTLVILMVACTLFAQKEVTRGPFLTNGFGDNWFVSIGFGGNVYAGENDSELGFGDRIATALDISAGKWLTPSMGLRLQYAGINAKGKAPANSMFADNNGNEEFNIMNLHADYMFNIHNAFLGYRADRTWELIPFLGFGWAQATKSGIDNKSNELAASAGLLNKFRISDAVDFNLELRGMIANQRLDGVEGGTRAEGMASATVGFSYKFGKRTFEPEKERVVPDYSPYTARISDLEKQINDEKIQKKAILDELNQERSKAPETLTKVEYLSYPLSVYFALGSSKVPHEDLFNLNNYAEIIKKSGKVFKILGSPDKLTGNPNSNKKLSEDRANAVYEALVYKFGVNPKQLEIVEKQDAGKNPDNTIIGRAVIFE